MFDENKWTHGDIRREKEVIYREIETCGNRAYKRMVYDFFEETQQGEDILGTKNKISRITRPQIIEWKKKLFKNPELIICGGFSDKQLTDAYNVFSTIPVCTGQLPTMTAPEHFAQRSTTSDRYYNDDFTHINIGFSFDLTVEKSVAELLKATLFDLNISPFNMRLREEAGLFYDYDAHISYFDFGGVLILLFNIHKDYATAFIRKFSDVLIGQKDFLDEDAFECAKMKFVVEENESSKNPCDTAYQISFNKFPLFKISYSDAVLAMKKVFVSKNMIVNINDVPFEEDLLKALYEEKNRLRERLDY